MHILGGLILMLVALSLFFVIVLCVFYLLDLFLEIPYVGANKESIETMMELANIKKGETIVDLGSGDGRLLFAAADREAFATGYEISPFLILLSKIKRKLKGYQEEVRILDQSMWKADLKVADVIFVYSLSTKIAKFEQFIKENAAPGTRIIVNTNPFKKLKPKKTIGRIYLYTV